MSEFDSNVLLEGDGKSNDFFQWIESIESMDTMDNFFLDNPLTSDMSEDLLPSDFSLSSPNSNQAFQPLDPELKYETPMEPVSVFPPLLLQVEQMFSGLVSQIESIRETQKLILVNPQQESYQQMLQHELSISNDLNVGLNLLHELYSSTLLLPQSIEKLQNLKDQMNLFKIQIDLFLAELQSLAQPTTTCSAALVIYQQPFPNLFMKEKPMTEHEFVEVKILTGANVSVIPKSEVSVSMVYHNTHNAKKSKPSLDVMSFQLDPLLSAKFQSTFLSGTWKDLANLKFSVQVSLNENSTVTLESDFSKPFVVNTNESQYGDSLGILLRRSIWNEQASVTWPLVANELQNYFLKATRQNLVQPERGLSSFDLQYLNHIFFGSSPTVEIKAFQTFWNWFGKVIPKLRFQRHLCSMWKSGLIYGFINKEIMEAVLLPQPEGSFILRFSESNPGTIAIGYRVSGPQQIKNYLVKTSDITGTRKSLADFLRVIPQFSTMLQFTGVYYQNGVPVLKPFPKDLILEPYYSSTSQNVTTKGYDELS